MRKNRIEYNTCQQPCSTCINNCIDNRINNLTGRPYLSLSIYLPTPIYLYLSICRPRPLHVALRDVARRFPHAHISNACVGFGIRRSYHVGSHDVWLAVVPLLVVSRDNSASTVGRRNTCNSPVVRLVVQAHVAHESYCADALCLRPWHEGRSAKLKRALGTA